MDATLYDEHFSRAFSPSQHPSGNVMARALWSSIGKGYPMFRFVMKTLATILSFLSLLLLAGCDAPVDSYVSNEVHLLTLARSRDVAVDQVRVDLPPLIEQLFGTPNQPRWPVTLIDSGLVLNLEELSRVAGKVSSEEDGTHHGLFREHCVACHSLSGSGTGPAALFQNPYPRDFRVGVYKWKSTQRDAKPRRQDLLDRVHQGIPGTGMPSFALVDQNDIEALVDYVIYLSVRGEVERRLMAASIDELGYGEDSIHAEDRMGFPKDRSSNQEGNPGEVIVSQVVAEVTRTWAMAPQYLVSVPEMETFTGEALNESIQRGQEIFHGQIANCAGCHGKGGHGKAGHGGVSIIDFDDWTKEYTTRLGIDPKDREALRPFKQAGALTPRYALPRDLTQGVFRGGGDVETLYRRIVCGIAGTPMPAVAVVDSENGRGLTSAQIFDLIRYVRSLGKVATGN